LSEKDQQRRSSTLVFEAMANKTLHEFSAPTTANIRTGPTVNVGDEGFELKPALINMVQANQFCEKAHEDASAYLQYFLEICSTFTIKGVERDAIVLHLLIFLLLGRATQWFYVHRLHCFPSKVLSYRQNKCPTCKDLKFLVAVR